MAQGSIMISPCCAHHIRVISKEVTGFMSNETKSSNIKIKSAGLRVVQNQKAWKFIREANSDLRQLSHIAIEDGANKYSYGVMFRNWERYASVLSAL